jgi:ABC-type glycerol-3-phosphate transport system substrate-binding protein
MLTMLVACGTKNPADTDPDPTTAAPSPSESTPSEPTGEEDVSLLVWGTPSGQLDGQNPGEWIEKDLVSEWNAEYPNISVNVELIPFDGINEKLTTAIQSGKNPDVYLDYPGRILAYANMGVVAELDDIIPDDKLEIIKSNPDIMKMVSVNGKIVVMPYYTTTTMLVVNKTLWEEAGKERPRQ